MDSEYSSKFSGNKGVVTSKTDNSTAVIRQFLPDRIENKNLENNLSPDVDIINYHRPSPNNDNNEEEEFKEDLRHVSSMTSVKSNSSINSEDNNTYLVSSKLSYLENSKYKTLLKCRHGNYIQLNKTENDFPLFTCNKNLTSNKWVLTTKVENGITVTSLMSTDDDLYIGNHEEKICSSKQVEHYFKMLPVQNGNKTGIILVSETGSIISCNCANEQFFWFPMCYRAGNGLNNIHSNCIITLSNLTNLNETNIDVNLPALLSNNDTIPLVKYESLYQQQRLKVISDMDYLPLGKIESVGLYCSHGLQVCPTRDSITNPSITSALQTMNTLPEDYRSSSMNVYENNVSVNKYMPACVVSFEYNIYNKNNEEIITYVASLRNDRLWISNAADFTEDGQPVDVSSPLYTPSSASANNDKGRDSFKFLLIPNPHGGVLVQSNNKNFMCCMCPKSKTLLNNSKDQICYGMGLKNIGSKGNSNFLFTLKVNSKPYGTCGYSYLEEETKQILLDLYKPNLRREVSLHDHKIYINDEKACYTRDYIIGDYNPLLKERSNYFIADSNASTNVISVLVPCFTEPAKALQRTLLDLELQQRELQFQYKDSKWELNVLIVCDGWFKASKSLRKYIKTMFEITDEQSQKLLDWEIDQDATTGVQTMILQRVRSHINESQINSQIVSSQGKVSLENKSSNININSKTSNNSLSNDLFDIEPVKIYSSSTGVDGDVNVTRSVKLKVSVLIKRDNRRKHNSHEWFLYTFAPLYCKSEYLDGRIKQAKKLIYLTDCGTRFHPSCLTVLVDHMLYNDDCMAASGRQRVMSVTMQDSASVTYHSYDNITPRSNKSSTWTQMMEPFTDFIGFLYRASQCFDYEASISCFSGVFSATGMLPVIPGPCGLFRQDILLNEGFKNTSIKQQRIQQETLLQILLKMKKTQMKIKYIDSQLQEKLWSYIKRREDRLRMQMNNITGYTNSTFVSDKDFSMKRMQAGIQSLLIDFDKLCSTSLKLIQKIVSKIQIDKNCRLLSDEIITDAEASVNSAFDYFQRMPEIRIMNGLYDLQQSAWKSLWQQVPESDIYIQIQDKIHERDTSLVQTLGEFHSRLTEKINHLQEMVVEKLKETTTQAQLAPMFELDNNEEDDNLEDYGETFDVDVNAELKTARDPYDMYFQTVNKIPEEAGSIEGSLLLAEDRVLSYAIVIKSGRSSAHTSFVPNALFYFEAETEAEPLLAQRRRWINGTVAGYIWLLQHWRIMDVNIVNIIRLMLILLQVLIYGIVAISPSLWAIGMHFSLSTVFPNVSNKYSDWTVWCYILFYILFVYRHTEYRDPKEKLDKWMLHVFTFIHFFATIIIGYGLVQAAFAITDQVDYSNFPITFVPTNGNVNTSLVTTPTCNSDIYYVAFDFSITGLMCWGIIRIIIFTTALPALLALLYDIYWYLPCDRARSVLTNFRSPSLFLMILTAPFFYLFLPTMVGTFAVYAFSRTWDLTWGNKPSESLKSLGSTIDKAKSEKIQRETLQNARLVSYSIVSLNIFLFLFVVEFELNKYVLAGATIFVLIWGLMQMVMSLIWILWKIFKRAFLLESCRKTYLDYFRVKQT
jgi:hypothetical protein